MIVNELRHTLGQLVALLQAADAKKGTVGGLQEFIDTSAPFGDLTLKGFVALAEAGRSPGASAVGGRKPTGKAKADAGAVAAEVRALYESAGDPSVGMEQVRAACERLGPLTKDALVALSEAVGLVGMKAKKKDDIARAITDRLVERKGAAIKRQLLDRPGEPAGATEPTPHTPVR